MKYSRRGQKFIHAGYDPSFGRRMNRQPGEFVRVKGRKPVRGGRWGVRKLTREALNGGFWEAYTFGGAKILSKTFDTQVEAVAHAHWAAALVARTK